MDRRLFMAALAGGVATTTAIGFGTAEASPAQPARSADLEGVRSALSPGNG